MKKLWSAFRRGFSNTLGIAQVQRYIETPEEIMARANAEVRTAVAKVIRPDGPIELPRAHDLRPRRWLMPDGAIVGDALVVEAVELLKNDPDEYFRRTRGG